MIFFNTNSRLFVLALSLSVVLFTQIAVADDTEIFFSESTSSVNSNVMFVIDVSGSMDADVPDSGGKNRLEVMQDALKTVLSTAPENLNVGLMNYGEVQWYDQGHGVKFPITDIQALARPVVIGSLTTDEWGYTDWWNSSIPEPDETVTVRQYLSEITDWYWKDNWTLGDDAEDMQHSGVTPIVDALYETALYFRGEKVTFGLSSTGYWARTAAHQSTYEGPAIAEDEFKCETTDTRSLKAPIDFAANEYPWYKCPADVNNPTSPGSYNNCKATENCTTTTSNKCVNKIPSYCTEKLYDEIGNYTCTGTWVPTVCVDNVYEDVTTTRCKYEVCEVGYTPEPDYKTPITQACQSNFIVLLSDGKPEYGDGTTVPSQVYTKLENGEFSPILDKFDSTNQFDHIDCDANPTPSGYRSGTCGPELTKFLSEADNSDLEGVQTIDTYAIGFGLGGEASATDYLKSLVSTDDPSTPAVEGYFSAEDEVQLSQAFSHILAKISSTTTSFASPGYSVDLKTGLFNEEDIYIPVFDKGLTPRWSGNLKKFKLSTNASGKTYVADKNGLSALDDLGVFSTDAVDFWSAVSTGGEGRVVAKGGVAQLINPDTRKAFTDIACTSYPCQILTIANNQIHPSNDESNSGVITNAALGLSVDETDSTRINMLNFIRGRKWNEETSVYDALPHMGDMLHTEPLIVTYRKDFKTDDIANGQVIYATTNEGYLHAFDTLTGQEIFAFMPSSLMKNIPVQFYNSSIGKHAYGIDGIMSKRIVRAADGSVERVLLYFGLRRGGREYYAMDVTNPANPKLLWKVDAMAQQALEDSPISVDSQRCKNNEEIKSKCTVDGVMGEGDFARLGQSWSTPYLAKIRISDTDFKDVVIFSGGYDTNQDEEDHAIREATDTVGNEVFIVDAMTGSLLWSAHDGGSLGSGVSNAADLQHSIPGGMRIIDMNQDGAVDRMYFADTIGKVWRLELPLGPDFSFSGAKLVNFANLGTGTGAGRRMFFNEPDVALLKKDGRKWLTVSLGSGYRAHPANGEANDEFYVLLDAAVNEPLEKNIANDADFAVLDHDDLVKIASAGSQEISSIDQGVMTGKAITSIADKAGWYFDLPKSGEKVLASSITSEGNVMFTTLVPDLGTSASSEDLCSAPITQGRFYSFNILTGEAGSDLNRDGTITDVDLMAVVTANEIPGTPQRIFNKPTCAGKECSQIVDIRVGKRNHALTTYDASLLENVFWTDPERK